jgi:hypothetical protein
VRSASVEVVEYARPRDEKYEADVVEKVPSFASGTQVPFTEKHPAAILKPFDRLDVAPPVCVNVPLTRKFDVYSEFALTAVVDAYVN